MLGLISSNLLPCNIQRFLCSANLADLKFSLEHFFLSNNVLIVGTMKLVRRLVLTKNTPMILKAKLVIKLKVIMSPFISRLLLGQKSVASYRKMGR